MMYTTRMQNLNLKYIMLWPIQKGKISQGLKMYCSQI
jgi:hypothetical protein